MTCTSRNEITRLQNFSIDVIINIIFIIIGVIVTCTSLWWSLLFHYLVLTFTLYTSAMQYWSCFTVWVQYALSSQIFPVYVFHSGGIPLLVFLLHLYFQLKFCFLREANLESWDWIPHEHNSHGWLRLQHLTVNDFNACEKDFKLSWQEKCLSLSHHFSQWQAHSRSAINFVINEIVQGRVQVNIYTM